MNSPRGPDVSVIIPAYNAERWIDPALRSIATQDGVCVEIILIDDGSTDRTLTRAIAAMRDFPRFHILRNNGNQGIVESLNLGIKHASGRFIARMDADDLCLPDRFRKQMQFLESTGIDLCGSWFREFGYGMLPRAVRWPHTEATLRAAMLFQNSILHPSVLARREVFERYKYRHDYQLAEDYDLWVRASQRFRLANVPDILVRYRRHGGQATQERRAKMERITQKIRSHALEFVGLSPDATKLRLHNLIRAPESIRNTSDLDGIEAWLIEVMEVFDDEQARATVASNWTRACVRAAPLGRRMWDRFRASPLHYIAGASVLTEVDLKVLSLTKLDYAGRPFSALRTLGLSA